MSGWINESAPWTAKLFLKTVDDLTCLYRKKSTVEKLVCGQKKGWGFECSFQPIMPVLKRSKLLVDFDPANTEAGFEANILDIILNRAGKEVVFHKDLWTFGSLKSVEWCIYCRKKHFLSQKGGMQTIYVIFFFEQ